MRLTNLVDELRADHPWMDVIGVETVTTREIVPGDEWKNWGPHYAGSGPLGVTVHHDGSGGLWVSAVRFEWFKYENVKATNCQINDDGRVAILSAGSAATNGTVNVRQFSRGPGGRNSDQFTIEVHNPGNGTKSYPAEQMRSILAVCYTVNRLSGNLPSDVCTHREVASPFGRKSDPAAAHNIEGPYAGRIRPTGPAATWNADDLRAVAVDFANSMHQPPPPPDEGEGDVLATATWSPGRYDQFTTGPQKQLLHRWFEEGVSERWSAWEDLGGILVFGPTAVSRYANRIDIFGVGQDLQMWQIAWDSSQGGWSSWIPLGGLFTANPSVSNWGPDRMHVFGNGVDDRIYQNTWENNQWSGWFNTEPDS